MSRLIMIILKITIMTVVILCCSVNTSYVVKADVEETQYVQEQTDNNIPVTIDDIEAMSITDKLLLAILLILCLFFGSFVGYVVVDRMR